MSKRVLFLFTELSDYFLNCINKASENDFEIHIIIYPLNKEAPFDFEIDNKIFLYNRAEFNRVNDFECLIKKIKPKILFISGWIDQQYLKTIKLTTPNIKKILMIDTTWVGSLKQIMWAIFFKNFFKRYFDFIWVPGKPQKLYAQKLGFEIKDIFYGLYTCNDNIFNKDNFKNDYLKRRKRLLYIGRYSDEKGLLELWDNFIKLNSNFETKWELWCVGTGKLWKKRPLNKYIKHFGFIQPHLIPDIASKCDIYVMPSKYEPWGVSLQEIVSLGKPVLVSEDVGSSCCFVNENKNGFKFSYTKVDNFHDMMKKTMLI